MTCETEHDVISPKLSPVSMNDAVTGHSIALKDNTPGLWGDLSQMGLYLTLGSGRNFWFSDFFVSVIWCDTDSGGGRCTHREEPTPSVSEWDPVSDCDSTFAWPPGDSRHVWSSGPILLPSLYFLWSWCFISYLYLTNSLHCSSCELSHILSGTRWGMH